MNKIQLRPHRGTFAESMTEVVEIEERDDVFSYLLCHFPVLRARREEITQKFLGRDNRCGWNCWLIRLRGEGVLWTDAPVPGIPRDSPFEAESA